MTDARPFDLGSLRPAAGSVKRGRYLGRGRSSGHGKTSGRGIKGQMARTGAKRRRGFPGGDVRAVMRIPKRGFVSPFKIRYRVVNLDQLAAALFDDFLEGGAGIRGVGHHEALGQLDDIDAILGTMFEVHYVITPVVQPCLGLG